MNNSDSLRLLIVEKSENDAETLANILRDAGHCIGFAYARDAATFESALLAQAPDIVLCGNGDGVISTETVQGLLAQRKTSPPVIAIVEDASEAAMVAAGKSGIAALVSYTQPAHLEMAVSREARLVQLQRKVTELEAALDACQDRSTALIESSTDASPAALDDSMEMMARLDTLTGLCNRQHFMSLLEKDVTTAENEGEVRALIYITLDGFKKIREENGIAASDKVLCELARLLEQQCDKKDSIARFGDYSYTIMHHNSSCEKVQAMAEKLLRHISGHVTAVSGRAITITCSIGICAVTEHTTDAQKILSHADTACEVARSSGGNQIHTHSAVIDEQVAQGNENEWDKVIRKTIDEQRFYLAYQPIISLGGDTSKCYEALLRVVDEEGHTILPGQFIELAEKFGLSCEIDYWVYEAAFSNIAKLREYGDDITVYMKLSRSTLADINLPAWIFDKLKEYKLSHSSVVFEIRELDAANDLRSAITFIKAMKKMQCKVALEHFGLNNQPQLLKHVPADILKIDGSLINGLAGNKEKQSRVKALVRLSHALGTVSIAERVDNPGDLAILWQNGVDMIQGNFIQAPSRVLDYDFEGEIA